MPTYGRLDVTFTKGEGAWLWDQDNKRYLDALSGIAVCSLGHAHPAVHKALCAQSQQLVHTSNLYHIPGQEKLATKLCELSGVDNVFFSNSKSHSSDWAVFSIFIWILSFDVSTSPNSIFLSRDSISIIVSPWSELWFVSSNPFKTLSAKSVCMYRLIDSLTCLYTELPMLAIITFTHMSLNVFIK